MKRLVIIAITLLCLIVSNMLCAEPIHYVVPGNSPVTLKDSSSEVWLEFAGQFEMQAKYQFIYAKEPVYAINPYLLLYPSEQDLKRLPYLTERGKPERAVEIFVENSQQAMMILLDKSIAAKLSAGEYGSVSGEARLIVNNFNGGYECDAPSFVITLVNLSQTITEPEVINFKDTEGC